MTTETQDFATEQPFNNLLSENQSSNNNINFIEEVILEKKDNNSTKAYEQQRNLLLQQINNQFRIVKENYYYKDEPCGLAFVDLGKRITTPSNDERTAIAMVDMAQAKGWQSMNVSGHPEFQRKIWREAVRRDIEVHGYTPTEQELQELNKIKSSQQDINDKVSPTTSKESIMINAIDDNTIKAKQNDNKEKVDEPFMGRIIDHGVDHYLNEEKNRKSYYIKLFSVNGERTIWGADIPRAMTDGGVDKGDYISLLSTGSVKVENTNFRLNKWEAKKLNDINVIKVIGERYIDSKEQDPQKREKLKEGLNRKLIEKQKTDELPSIGIYDKNSPGKNITHQPINKDQSEQVKAVDKKNNKTANKKTSKKNKEKQIDSKEIKHDLER